MEVPATETAQLLQQLHQGGDRSLETLLERHLPWIRSRVRQRLGPALRKKAETGDYVHDAIVEFLQYGPKFMLADESSFRALMVLVVENSLRNRHRWFVAARREIARERPLPSTTILSLDSQGVSPDTPSQSAERREREAWVRLAMETVTPDHREVLVLRMWQERSFAEIGAYLGIEENTARKRHHRAIRSLAASVGKMRREGIASVLEGSTS